MGADGAVRWRLFSLALAFKIRFNVQMEVCPVFIDETGILSGPAREQPVYGIGALVIPDTREITDRFYRLHFNFVSSARMERNEIRRNIRARGEPASLEEVDRLMWSTRHHEYKFSEVTRSNLEQYIDLVDMYFSFQDLEFHSLIVNRLDEGFDLEEWSYDKWKAYADFTRQLLDRSLTRDVFAIVDLQEKPEKSPDYIEDVLCSVDSVKGCLRATSDMSVYLQIVDVLLGCVQFDWRDRRGFYASTSKRAQVKRDLVNSVKSRLGMERETPFVSDEQPFNKWDTPSAFSVWNWNATRQR